MFWSLDSDNVGNASLVGTSASTLKALDQTEVMLFESYYVDVNQTHVLVEPFKVNLRTFIKG